ncbi:hypothetical protein [Mangrovibacterium marinum]|uniref:WxL domain-containing protein n=1 Tax=Mangrovibacterium marinum TaxID=1639118 RepID=A0A2T5C6G7_9BACT|nr:hypothetical protein [Mangrovibacterium marinum]PTN10549.1 hypothetical protein C8N47_101199 [Mangrovibacterium marinum]
MKKVFTFIALAFIAFSSFASNDKDGVESSEVITLTARLNSTIALDMDNSDIVFEFNELNDFRNGLGGYEKAYQSTGTISATANWNLSFFAKKDFTHTSGNTMPLDNVGLSAKFTGKNSIADYSNQQPLKLSKQSRLILGYNGSTTNAGDASDNAFTIYWEMGTKKNDMNGTSIYDQNLKKGEYKTEVEFVASEVL